LRPDGADKGSAIRDYMREPPFAGRMPVFAGDDLGDEAGFIAVNALGGRSVLVGARRDSAARYALADPAAVREWLERRP
jgi:trehalose 6-phosphate phosphatase